MRTVQVNITHIHNHTHTHHEYFKHNLNKCTNICYNKKWAKHKKKYFNTFFSFNLNLQTKKMVTLNLTRTEC